MRSIDFHKETSFTAPSIIICQKYYLIANLFWSLAMNDAGYLFCLCLAFFGFGDVRPSKSLPGLCDKLSTPTHSRVPVMKQSPYNRHHLVNAHRLPRKPFSRFRHVLCLPSLPSTFGNSVRSSVRFIKGCVNHNKTKRVCEWILRRFSHCDLRTGFFLLFFSLHYRFAVATFFALLVAWLIGWCNAGYPNHPTIAVQKRRHWPAQTP